MLVITRHEGEALVITAPDGTEIVVRVVRVRRGVKCKRVRLGTDAPKDYRIDRGEFVGHPALPALGGEDEA